MITFHDGPAAYKANGLCLRRAPFFLRVVVKAGRTAACKPAWDALDQLHDAPDRNETIYVYRLVKNHGSVHIRRQRGGGFYVHAEYSYHPTQPSDAVLRDAEQWAEWCTAEYGRLEAEKSDAGTERREPGIDPEDSQKTAARLPNAEAAAE